MYRKVSVHSTITAEYPVGEVQHLLLGTFLSPMYNVEQHVNWKCHINKGKAIGSTQKISHFVGCEMLSSQHFDVIQAEMFFTHFFVVHIAL